MPSTLESIGDRVFRYSALKEIEIPEKVTNIPSYMIESNKELEKVILHKGIKEIGLGAFMECKKLEHIQIPETCTRIDEKAFYATGIKSLVLPKSVGLLGVYSFTRNRKLEKLVIEGSIDRIPKYCSKLKEVILSKSGVRFLGYKTFLGCRELEHMHIPECLRQLEKGSLAGTKVNIDSDKIEGIEKAYEP